MTDINQILREELPPDTTDSPLIKAHNASEAPLNAQTLAPYNASDAVAAAYTSRAPAPAILAEHAFPPGVSGNPLGAALTSATAPAGVSGRYELSRALRETLSPRRARAVAEALIAKAEAGSARHFAELRDSTEGKPVQRIQMETWAPEDNAVFQQMMALKLAQLAAEQAQT